MANAYAGGPRPQTVELPGFGHATSRDLTVPEPSGSWKVAHEPGDWLWLACDSRLETSSCPCCLQEIIYQLQEIFNLMPDQAHMLRVTGTFLSRNPTAKVNSSSEQSAHAVKLSGLRRTSQISRDRNKRHDVRNSSESSKQWHAMREAEINIKLLRLALYLGSMLRSTVALHNLINNKMRNKQQKAGEPHLQLMLGSAELAGKSCGAKGLQPPLRTSQFCMSDTCRRHGKDKDKKDEAKKEKEEACHDSRSLASLFLEARRSSESSLPALQLPSALWNSRACVTEAQPSAKRRPRPPPECVLHRTVSSSSLKKTLTSPASLSKAEQFAQQ